MNSPGQSSYSPGMLQGAFAWLAARPAHDPALELAPLKRHLSEVAEASVSPEQRLKLFQLFEQRIRATSLALKPQLIEAKLPLQSHLRLIAQGLMDIHGILANNLLRCNQEIAAVQVRSSTWGNGALIETILGNLAEQQQIALLATTAPPAGLWTRAQAAYRLVNAASQPAGSESTAERIFKGMLALAAAQPETLTARENAAICRYLPEVAGAVRVEREPPPQTDDWFWLEENRDLPPVAFVRRPPPVHGTKLYFSCTKLADLPDLATAGEFGNVLTRAQLRWRAPPRRQSPRRTSHYRVEICAPLGRLWSQLRDIPSQGIYQTGLPITQWMVLNESASGYAMMHVSGVIDDLVAGDVLGVRNSPDRPWHICLLRWGRSDNPAHIEVGLERVAPAAAPVKLAYHSRATSGLVPGLLLGLPPNGDGEEALIVERGMLEANRFTLIGDDAGRVQLTECQVDRLALQTARVEKFKFRRDYAA